MSNYAPRIITIKIPVDKIRDVIGPGGKMIRSIIERTGVKIDVEDDGTVNVASADGESAAKAIGIIQELTATPELNKTYMGKVQRITDFGAFVEIMAGTDGLLHVSEIANHRVKDVRDELKEGQQIMVKVINIDPTGKIRLSRKALLTGRGDGTGRSAAAASAGRLRPTLDAVTSSTLVSESERARQPQIMRFTRRTIGFAALPLLSGPASCWPARSSPACWPIGQDQAPNRREFTVTARDYRFSPARLEVTAGRSGQADGPQRGRGLQRHHRRVPGVATRPGRRRRPPSSSGPIATGTFAFYSNLTSDTRHAQMRGELVVFGR